MELFFETARECWSTIHSGGWPELGWWSYLLLALLVATEGPVSTLLGAAAAATGILDIQYVFLSALLGNVLGDCLWYSVGYVNDLKKIQRFGRWLGIHSHYIDRLEHEMHTHATKLIALSKLAIGLIVPTLVAAGLARVPWRRWFPLVLLIEVIWTFLMINLGFYGAGLLTQLERGLQLIGVGVALVLISGAIWYGRRFFAQREAALATEFEPADGLSAAVTCVADRAAATNLTFVRQTPEADTSLIRKALYQSFPQRSFSLELAACKRNTYKQLLNRFSTTRLPAPRLTSRSLTAKSAMTRAIGRSSATAFSPSRHSRPPRQVQIHFAGD
jgi:membrane protein DedA with SNARE-associated domain